jgi:hypothetical protein
VRNRRIVGYASDVDALSGKAAERALSASSHAADDDIDLLHADDGRFVAYQLTDLRRRKRRPLLGSRVSVRSTFVLLYVA